MATTTDARASVSASEVRRVSAVVELSGATTFQDFDGYGKANRLGDHMLSLTAGLSFNIGKVGWRRAIDAAPYIRRNERLTDYVNLLSEENRRYAGMHDRDRRTQAELKKILQIEGLLAADSATYIFAEGECIGSPVYFFFRLNTARLTDASQRLNLDELARIANKYDLSVRITGAADSETGTAAVNDSLSASRADYITAELQRRGVPADRLVRTSRGGIADHTSAEANRHTKVELFVTKRNK